jgi:hypothetical protein
MGIRALFLQRWLWLGAERSEALRPASKMFPLLWFDNVELYSARSPEAFKENRGYPRNILKRWVPLYLQF